MQVKNLDKFAKKLKKQYSDALSQNDEAIKEIKFIDGKLAYLKGKYKILTDNLAHRKTEVRRVGVDVREGGEVGGVREDGDPREEDASTTFIKP